jgi:hypothetical protein
MKPGKNKFLLGGAGFLVLAGASYLALRWIYHEPGAGGEPRDWLGRRIIQPMPDPALLPPRPAPLATWPLPGARRDSPHKGVNHWYAQDKTGTAIDFFDFDFGKNPRLRWSLFDQDEDDAKPGDNHVWYRRRNVAAFTQQFNAGKIKHRPPGRIIAAWNGAFFGYYDHATQEEAFHVSPIVLNGKVRYNNANHRWTFGVKYTEGGQPVWKTTFKPGRKELEEFDWAAGSVQCLVKDGQPLQLEPFPKHRSDIEHGTHASTAQEAGYIPVFDHMHTCRASIGWSKDNRHLYLLFIKEPDNEAASAHAFSWGKPDNGGWTVPDLQRFWLKKGVWGAINSDAGNVAQLIYAQPTGYTLVPSRHITDVMRFNCPPSWKDTPQGGGSLMYFYVWEKRP